MAGISYKIKNNVARVQSSLVEEANVVAGHAKLLCKYFPLVSSWIEKLLY